VCWLEALAILEELQNADADEVRTLLADQEVTVTPGRSGR